MSNTSDNSGKSPSSLGSVEQILKRVAAAAGTKNDAALARVLGVSRQTLSSWKKRGTVPHEAVASFAAEKDLPLDYLLLGKGSARRYDGVIDPNLMEEIGMEIEDLSRASTNPPIKQVSGLFAYYCCIVYNRIFRIARPEDNPYDFVKDEVRYLLDLLARENADAVTVRVHPEIARHIEGVGSNVVEVYSGPGVSKVIVDQASSTPRKAVKSSSARSKKR